MMMKTNGWVNASKMCTDGGKKFHDWQRLQGTKELFAEYEISRHLKLCMTLKQRRIIHVEMVMW